ncbi:MAG: hypothetical protein KC505_02480 [Myxococcales bacterium]|nr:hypothetical protein [Myxococcales bacterium]USN50368.1 MAG: hypothetical protein H6731_08900 [Myxococcales bacterium]
MNTFQYVFFSLFAVVSWTSDFSQAMEEQYGYFVTIKQANLENAIKVPEQTTLWGCGLHQVAHTMVCAGASCEAMNFQNPGDYPLSVNLNTTPLRNNPMIGGMIEQMITDEEGNFRVGATPRDMAQFLDGKLQECNKHSCVISKNELTKEELLEIVQENIENDMPVLAYYVVNAEQKLMHIYSIVGYTDDNLLLLNTYGKGIQRLEVMAIDDFMKGLDASSIVNFVKMIDGFGFIVRPLVASMGGKLADSSAVQAWNNFSLISFAKGKCEEVPLLTKPQQNAECSIQ